MRFVIAAILCLVPFAAHAWDKADMNRMIDSSNFVINNDCSGTLLDAEKGYMLTAHHCVMDHYKTVDHEQIGADGVVHKVKVRVAIPGHADQLSFKDAAEVQRTSYIFKVIKDDNDLDLALVQLQSPPKGHIAPKIACTEPERGDHIFAVGNSYVALYASVTDGMVSSVTRSYRDLGLVGDLGDNTDSGEHGLVQHSAPIVGGNSGGALYNDAGEFAGVNVRGAATGFSFAVPLSDVKQVLSREGLDYLWARCPK